jgi:formylglycine-generating enzyme required for sulfatase activity
MRLCEERVSLKERETSVAMENKRYSADHTQEDPDGTIPFTGLPKPRQSSKRQDSTGRSADFDLTTPNIPVPNVDLSIPPARPNDNFDLTEMRIRVFDADEEHSKSVIVKPQREKGQLRTDTRIEPARRRRLPTWAWLTASAISVLLVTVLAVAVFVLWPRNSAFTLKVLEAPPGSKVFVDGLPSGVPQSDGTVVVHGLRADENREVIVKHEQFDDWTTSVKGEAGKELVITAKLTPKAKATADPLQEIDYTGLMELIPAGSFIMGDNSHRPDEGPEHEVTLQSFYIDKFEVTNEQYRRFCDETHHPYPPSPFWNPEYFTTQPHAPVVGVSWDDAAAYAKWAGKRLPTEEEWEKAASWDPQSQKKRRWPWGNSPEANRSNVGLPRNVVRLADVNQNPMGASAYSVQDMAGNAAEWVDAYYQGYSGNAKENSEFGTKNRVVRGGTSVSNFEDARTTRRFPRPSDYTAEEKASNAYLIGFRCAVSADDSRLQEHLKGKTR